MCAIEAFSLVRSTQTDLDDEDQEEVAYNENTSTSQANSNDDSIEKERTSSNESSSSATLAAFLQTARNRISSLSGIDIMNGILNSADSFVSANNPNTSTLDSSSISASNVPYIEPPTQNDS